MLDFELLSSLTMANIQTTNAPLGVAVVDDDENTRLWYEDILRFQKNFSLTGSFSNPSEALQKIPRLQPHIIFMDIRLPGLNGIECTKRLKHIMPRLKIIIVTGTHEQDCVRASIQAGAVAFLLKPLEGDQLLATLEVAANIQGESRGESKADDMCLFLSSREKDVLSGLAEGLLYKEISQKLGVSYAAVHKHQHNIFKKLRVTNRSEAIRIWLGSRGNGEGPVL